MSHIELTSLLFLCSNDFLKAHNMGSAPPPITDTFAPYVEQTSAHRTPIENAMIDDEDEKQPSYSQYAYMRPEQRQRRRSSNFGSGERRSSSSSALFSPLAMSPSSPRRAKLPSSSSSSRRRFSNAQQQQQQHRHHAAPTSSRYRRGRCSFSVAQSPNNALRATRKRGASGATERSNSISYARTRSSTDPLMGGGGIGGAGAGDGGYSSIGGQGRAKRAKTRTITCSGGDSPYRAQQRITLETHAASLAGLVGKQGYMDGFGKSARFSKAYYLASYHGKFCFVSYSTSATAHVLVLVARVYTPLEP